RGARAVALGGFGRRGGPEDESPRPAPGRRPLVHPGRIRPAPAGRPPLTGRVERSATAASPRAPTGRTDSAEACGDRRGLVGPWPAPAVRPAPRGAGVIRGGCRARA